jgi:hypothetical protein
VAYKQDGGGGGGGGDVRIQTSTFSNTRTTLKSIIMDTEERINVYTGL